VYNFFTWVMFAGPMVAMDCDVQALDTAVRYSSLSAACFVLHRSDNAHRSCCVLYTSQSKEPYRLEPSSVRSFPLRQPTETMDGISHTRNKRWNRRPSDGASLESLDYNIDPVGEDGFGDVRRNRCLRRIHTMGTMLGRDNVRMTEELRDRIAAAALASSATFITLSLLIFDGQGTKQEVIVFVYK
jgi:hypothetical protein